MARINKSDMEKFYDYNIDLGSKTLYLGSATTSDDEEAGVDHRFAELAIKGLTMLDSTKKAEPITIIMNNSGGDIYHAMAVYDRIKECESEVVVKVYGHVMSAAVWILQAADHRMLAEHSRMMLHTGTYELADNHPEINKAWAKQYEWDEQEFNRILLERILERQAEFTLSRLNELLRFDTILTPVEAINLGLADGVI